MIEVKLEKGAVIPPHGHPHEQTGYLISGQMEFVVDGENIIAKPGDSWNIPGDVEHSATAIDETVVIEVFSPVGKIICHTTRRKKINEYRECQSRD